MTSDLGVENWMVRAGPDLNDSKEPTRHEECMEAEIAELRAKLEAAQNHIKAFSEIEEEIHRRAGKEGTETNFTVTITPEMYEQLVA